jgi:hypothetical protein
MDRIRGRLLMIPDDAASKIFFERAFDAVIQIGQMLPATALEETATANNNVLLMLRALQRPEILPELERYEPLASPFLQGLQAQQELLKEAGGLMSTEQVAELLGVSRQAVDKRRVNGKLIAIAQGGRGVGYPTCQFANRRSVTGLDHVLEALSGLDPWMQLTFLVSPNLQLGGRKPIDLMRKGELGLVLEAADCFGEHGAM